MNPEELQKKIGALEAKLKEKDDEIAKLKADLKTTGDAKGEAEKKAKDTAAEFAAYKDGHVKAAREARVDSLIAAGKLEPAKREETLSFAAALGGIEAPVSFSAADGKTETISAEEKHFRDLEAKQPDPRFVNFSLKAPLPGHATAQTPAWSPSDMTSKM